MGKNVCSGCNRTFGSLSAFDEHRVGSFSEPIYKRSSTGKSLRIAGYTSCQRRCLTQAELEKIGMIQNAKGCWVMPNSLTINDAEEITYPR